VAFAAVDGDDEQRQCAECGQIPPALFKGTKCSNCREVYRCCRKCQQKAWKTHKLLCRQIVADRRSVADIVGLQVGNFAEEDVCSWIKGKVLQWEGDAEGILALVRYLECVPLAVALAAARACCSDMLQRRDGDACHVSRRPQARRQQTCQGPGDDGGVS